MIADGLHPVLHRETYDAIDRTNFSWLKLFAKSPAHARYALTAPPEDTDPKRLGRVVHIAAFEPERFRNAIAVWDGPRRAGKDWEAFKLRNSDKELLTEDQYARCMAIQAAVRADATAMNYLKGGQGEVSLLWTATAPERGVELPAKGRIDFVAHAVIVDLKTTRDASQRGFERQAWSLGYFAQAAWYSDAWALITGERRRYVIVAVESEPPHVSQVYRVTDIGIERGRIQYSAWLDQLAWCREHNEWPGYTNGMELELSPPEWALPATEDDPTGLGLEIGSGNGL